jgi:excisionase family DNA binding protein
MVLKTVAQAAEALTVSTSMVYKLAHTGQLTVIRIGSGIRVPEDAIEDFLLAHRENTANGSISAPAAEPAAT